MSVSFLEIYFSNYIQLKAAEWKGMGKSLDVRVSELLFIL